MDKLQNFWVEVEQHLLDKYLLTQENKVLRKRLHLREIRDRNSMFPKFSKQKRGSKGRVSTESYESSGSSAEKAERRRVTTPVKINHEF